MTDRKQQAFNYFRGNISYGDEKDLRAWAKSDPANMSSLHAWEDEWLASEAASGDGDWSRVLGRIAVRQTLEEGELIKSGNRKNFTFFYAAAAAVVLLTAAFFIIPARRAPVLNYVSEAPVGEKCKVFLPDDTEVWLNSGSRLSYNSGFGRKLRTVVLSGEGYFNVAKDAKHPFIVDCGGAAVEVKGTKFNISAYPEDKSIVTGVTDGHVIFSSGDARIDLFKGQTASFNLLSGTFVRSRENPEDLCAWTESRLVFDNITLSELAEKLSRTYGVKFHFNAPEALDYRFNISLRNNETLSDIAFALEKTVPVRIRIDGDNVYIDGKHNQPTR